MNTLVLLLLVRTILCDDLKKIKGQQSVESSTVNKLVGAEGFSEYFVNLPSLQADQVNSEGLRNVSFVQGEEHGNVTKPTLVTETRKTIVTRLSIPLNPGYMDNKFYRETLMKFVQKNQNFLKNVTKDTASNKTLDLDLLTLKLWASATLRDNIVTVLGYLLFQNPNVLSEDLHSSLSQLYNRFRLRRISTIQLLPALQDMAFETPEKQIILLFEELDKIIPKYLRSSVTYWLENIFLKTIDLNAILKPENKTLIVDLLNGINSEAIPAITRDLTFNNTNEELETPKYVEEAMGDVFKNIMKSIAAKKIPLTQQLIATLILHLPLNRMCPQGDENERYFIDLLRSNKISNNFSEAIHKLNSKELVDPKVLIQTVLEISLKEIKDRDRINTMLHCLEEPKETYTLPTYDAMYKIFNGSVNVDLLLETIVAGEYPDDVMDAKNRLIYYINKKYIDFDFILRGFIKYDYHSPFDLIIALLTRIQLRSDKLPPEVISCVNSIKSHMIFRKTYNNLITIYPDMDINTLLHTFQSPSLPEDIRFLITEIGILLDKELINIPTQLKFKSINKCVKPRQCVVSIFNTFLESKIAKNEVLISRMKKLFQLVDENGDPLKKTVEFQCSGNDVTSKSYKFGHKETSDGEFVSQIYPSRKQGSPYVDEDSTTDVYSRPIYLQLVNVNGSILKIVLDADNGVLYQPPEVKDVVAGYVIKKIPLPHPGGANSEITALTDLLPTVANGTEDEKSLSPMKSLLDMPDILNILQITLNDHQKKGTLLLTILKKSVAQNLYKYDSTKKYIEEYIEFLEYANKVLPPPPPRALKENEKIVDFESLLQALPQPTDADTIKKYSRLKSFILQTNFSNILLNFNVTQYQTKGLLLKSLLHYLLESNAVTDSELLESIRFYENKVQLNGFGAQAVEYTIVLRKTSTKTIDLNDIFSILDTNSLSNEARKSLSILYEFLMTEFSPTIHNRGFDSLGYKTKGQFLKAFLEHLQSLYISNQVKQAINVIIPSVESSPRFSTPVRPNES